MDIVMDNVMDTEQMGADANAPTKNIIKKKFEKMIETMYEEINFALESDIGRFKTQKVKNEAKILKKKLDDIWNEDWNTGVNYRDILREIQSKVVAL